MAKRTIVQRLDTNTGVIGPAESLSACIEEFNSAGSEVSVGSFVSVNTLTRRVQKAQANNSTTLAYGIVTKLLSNTRCEVMTSGITTLTKSGVSAGAILYLSSGTAGESTIELTDVDGDFLQPVAKVLSVNSGVCTIELLLTGVPAPDLSNLLKLDRFVYASNDSSPGAANGALVIGNNEETLSASSSTTGVPYKLEVQGLTKTSGLESYGDIISSGEISGEELTSIDTTGGLVSLTRFDSGINDEDVLGEVRFSGKRGVSAIQTAASIVAYSDQSSWGVASRDTRLDINVASDLASDPVTVLSLYASTVSIPVPLVATGGSYLTAPVVLEGSPYPFTGSHVYKVATGIPSGSAVVLNNGVAEVSSSPRAKNCVGVAIQCKSLDVDSLGSSDNGLKVQVAAVGDNRTSGLAGFLVCNENGPVEAGDLLCTSSTPGYLMKQDDDIIRACTVGKALETPVFDADGKASGVYGFLYCG
jgi:hypothetical protein